MIKRTLNLVYHGVVYSKKNSRRTFYRYDTRKVVNIPSKQAAIQEQTMVMGFKAQRTMAWRPDEYATYSVRVQIYQKNKQRRDLDNQVTSILDALVRARILPDDDFTHLQHIEVDFVGLDKNDPRAIIEVTQRYATLAENAEK